MLGNMDCGRRIEDVHPICLFQTSTLHIGSVFCLCRESFSVAMEIETLLLEDFCGLEEFIGLGL